MANLLTTKTRNDLLDDLYFIIDTNRVGSSEIEQLEDCINRLESKKLKDIVKEDLIYVSNNCIDIYNYSDRIGSDEEYTLNQVINEIQEIVK